jgi:LacI family transcriptional regulator
MKDVARAAGVSQPTVSRVLQNHPNVREEVRQKVRQAVEKLKYRPNSLVSALMADLKIRRQARVSTTIAYVSAFSTPFGWRNVTDFADYYDGAQERAASQGYLLEPFWLHERGMTGPRLSTILYNRGIPSVLIGPLPGSMGHLSLDWSLFASVALGYTLTRPNLTRVTNDHFQTMLLVLRKLRWLGYRKVGFVMEAFSNARVSHRWTAAYLAFRMEFSMIARLDPFLPPSLTEENVVEWFLANRPDVIVGSDVRIITWLRGAGFDVPGDCGFANLSVGTAITNMAGANQNSRMIGASAVDMIVGQLHRNERGIPAHPKLTLISASWEDGPTVRNVRERKQGESKRRGE